MVALLPFFGINYHANANLQHSNTERKPAANCELPLWQRLASNMIDYRFLYLNFEIF